MFNNFERSVFSTIFACFCLLISRLIYRYTALLRFVVTGNIVYFIVYIKRIFYWKIKLIFYDPLKYNCLHLVFTLMITISSQTIFVI